MDYHGPTGPNNWYTDGRRFRQKCGACHTSGFDTGTGSWNDQDSPFMQKGVTCDSCHRGTDGSLVRDPGSLPFTERLELCSACHGRGSSLGPDGESAGQYGYPWSEEHDIGYLPGDNLADFYVQSASTGNFWPNGPYGENGNTKKHHQQYNDLLQSEHFEHEVGCFECHDPHDTENPSQTRLPGNELCYSCHVDLADANDYRLHSGHYPDVAKCADCHMPFTAKSVNYFDIRSHTFKIIAPDATVAAGGDPDGFSGPKDHSHVPNSCNSSTCHDGTGAGPAKVNTIAQLGLNYLRSLNGTAIKGDTDADGDVDFSDFAEFTKNWLEEAGWHVPE